MSEPEVLRCDGCPRVLSRVVGSRRVVQWVEHASLRVPDGVTGMRAGLYRFCTLGCLYHWAGSQPVTVPLYSRHSNKGGGGG